MVRGQFTLGISVRVSQNRHLPQAESTISLGSISPSLPSPRVYELTIDFFRRADNFFENGVKDFRQIDIELRDPGADVPRGKIYRDGAPLILPARMVLERCK